MQLDQNPFFRKAITPWYDSNFACWSVVVCMAVVFVFAAAGVFLAAGDPDFAPHAWFPGFLAFLSLFLILKILLRLNRRARNS